MAMDRSRFGVINGVTDKEYYTNSFHVPVSHEINCYQKISLEGPFHRLANAGHITMWNWMRRRNIMWRRWRPSSGIWPPVTWGTRGSISRWTNVMPAAIAGFSRAIAPLAVRALSAASGGSPVTFRRSTGLTMPKGPNWPIEKPHFFQ